MEFRKLKPEEIECRVQSVKSNGLVLLLYKDARVDQRLLDETVGATNWQRHHSRENANCVVSIWDDEKKQWVEKEDTGTESNTEAAKGLASDSFKRACFNWGIGRELYSAPFIWINASDCDIKDKKCYDRFRVKEIGYSESGDINRLEIVNENFGRVVYRMGESSAPKSTPKKKPEGRVDKLAYITELATNKYGVEAFCKKFKLDKIGDLTDDRLDNCIKHLEEL